MAGVGRRPGAGPSCLGIAPHDARHTILATAESWCDPFRDGRLPGVTTPPRHVLLTGVTGFVGQAVLVALLTDHPDARLTVLVRPKGVQTGQARLRALLRKPVFSAYVEQLGAEEAARRFDAQVVALEGDLADVPPLPGDVDVVIHSASSVSFDNPVDETFAANVGGAANLYDALLASGADPHVVHVSTAYVNGARRGLAVEGPLNHEVDWQVEMREGIAARERFEAESREPRVLRGLLERASKEHGRVGPSAVATAAEEARVQWVREQLVDYGRLRARSLGWTDVYTMSKALGERVAERTWRDAGRRLSVVRPTIIESSLERPYPGWIDGFKVADPLIAAYARGLLPEFPALADSVLDIIPVDHVVNVILAAAVRPAEPGEARYYQVASGRSNPLTFSTMHLLVRDYFLADPLPDSKGGLVSVPSWTFPYGRQVDAVLRRRERALGVLNSVVGHLPPSPRTLGWVSSLHRNTKGISSLRRYIDLYQPYTQTEAVFDDRSTRALEASLTPEERAARGFDVTAIDWRHYFTQVHIPGMIGQVREFAGRGRSDVAAPALKPGTNVLAIFDLSGTVAPVTPVEQYFWTELAVGGVRAGLAGFPKLLRAAPSLLRAEGRDRGEFLRSVMRRYAGVTDAEVRHVVEDKLGDVLRSRAYADALERVREHRAQGHRTVLITGSVDVFAQPLASEFDEVVAARMEVGHDGTWTGHFAALPLVGEARAAWLADYATTQGLDLAASYAYGDSYSDRSWLELVGNPTAVNPDADLYRYAKSHHWPIAMWHRSGSGVTSALTRSIRTPLTRRSV